jgi:hypothetical protein
LATAQENTRSEIVNPKGNWFFGAEIGENTIADDDHDQSLQGGVTAEYYMERGFSILGKLKYHKIGLTRNRFYSNQKFEGAVVTIPINLKFEWRIFRNLRGNLRFGPNLNQEVERKFQNARDFQKDLPRLYLDANFAVGISYFISRKTIVYFDAEVKGLGREREKTEEWLLPNATYNSFLNFGIKYNFKK